MTFKGASLRRTIESLEPKPEASNTQVQLEEGSSGKKSEGKRAERQTEERETSPRIGNITAIEDLAKQLHRRDNRS